VGAGEERRLVHDRPAVIWRNGDPAEVRLPPGLDAATNNRKGKGPGLFRRLVGRKGVSG